jgi:hypothetical protein
MKIRTLRWKTRETIRIPLTDVNGHVVSILILTP